MRESEELELEQGPAVGLEAVIVRVQDLPRAE